MNCLKLIVLVAATGLLNHNVAAQNSKPAKDVAFWGNEGVYLKKQAAKCYNLIDSALTISPPAIGAPIDRMLALYNFDAIVHETKYDNSESFRAFVDSRITKVVNELYAPIDLETKLYKIYNEGFVVESKSTTIAFDLVHGVCKGEKIVSPSLMKQIVDKCDILFITHLHGDHADKLVIEQFLAAGKPVVVPANYWVENDKLIHLRSDEIIDQTIKLLTGVKLKFKVLPGHQDELLNNIYVVTNPEGKTVAHVGDQYSKDDFEWIEDIENKIPRLDALVVNCWTYRLVDFVESFNPRLVVTAHENEMGHTIDHREAFWLTFQKMESIKHDYLVMGWGEWYQLGNH